MLSVVFGAHQPQPTGASARLVSRIIESEPVFPHSTLCVALSNDEVSEAASRRHLDEVLVDERDRRGALSDGRPDALDRSGAHVAGDEDPHSTRLERKRHALATVLRGRGGSARGRPRPAPRARKPSSRTLRSTARDWSWSRSPRRPTRGPCRDRRRARLRAGQRRTPSSACGASPDGRSARAQAGKPALIMTIGIGLGLAIAATSMPPLSHALGSIRPYVPVDQLAAILGVSALLAVLAL